jgi:hypothetical protein
MYFLTVRAESRITNLSSSSLTIRSSPKGDSRWRCAGSAGEFQVEWLGGPVSTCSAKTGANRPDASESAQRSLSSKSERLGNWIQWRRPTRSADCSCQGSVRFTTMPQSLRDRQSRELSKSGVPVDPRHRDDQVCARSNCIDGFRNSILSKILFRRCAKEEGRWARNSGSGLVAVT